MDMLERSNGEGMSGLLFAELLLRRSNAESKGGDPGWSRRDDLDRGGGASRRGAAAEGTA